MPHIVLEYSQNLETQLNVPAVLLALHEMLAVQGIDQHRIKTRGVPLKDVLIGQKGADGQMMHITLSLLEGRDIETRRKYGQALYDTLKAHAPDECSVTLEVREMVQETYF